VIPPVVDLDWWRRRGASVVTADVRWYMDGRSGQAAYEQGHLPGAVFVDLDRWLAGHGNPREGRHPLPDPAVFADGMAQRGIGDQDTVVAYDDAGGVIAARLVWMLRVTGHDAALLDGGLGVYDGPLETETSSTTAGRPRAVFTARPWPADRLADMDAAADLANTVLDARNADRYRGERDPVDPRPGHIPGARNLPCRENLDADGRFVPVSMLRQRFADLGVTSAANVVSYCGSGVTACHNLLALELAGLGHGRLYPGSWSQYSQDSGRPVATGSAPT
jgi:thiosulfate/3-mercaptopyruvate sulfurtransferase